MTCTHVCTLHKGSYAATCTHTSEHLYVRKPMHIHICHYVIMKTLGKLRSHVHTSQYTHIQTCIMKLSEEMISHRNRNADRRMHLLVLTLSCTCMCANMPI